MNESAARMKTVVGRELDPQGDGIADLEGKPIVVPGLLPGEEAEIEVTHRGRHQLGGRILRVLAADGERREPPCRHHGACHGCPLMAASAARQRGLKRDLLARHGLMVDDVIALPDREWGYRWSAKRIAFGRAGSLRLGSYRRRSHRPADMASCLVDHPDIVAAADEIVAVANRLGIDPFDERVGRGDLRYVWLRTNGRGAIVVTLLTARSAGSRVEELGLALERPSGVAIALQNAAGNDLRGRDLRMLKGEPLTVEMCGETVAVGPLGFLQPNPPVAALAYAALIGESRGTLAFDLYAGSGLTTRLLERRHERVLACESFPESASMLGIEPMTAAEFLADRLAENATPSLVIANPPRAGMGDAVCNLLSRLGPPELRIMSCHPRSLARDLELLEASGFDRADTAAFDTLPQTMHVEVVVGLVRR